MTKRDKGEGPANRETWQEWVRVPGEVDRDALLTMDEVLAAVRRFRTPPGIPPIKEIDVRTMNAWMGRGIIPRGSWCGKGYPGKRWPWWVADLLYLARRYYDAGVRSDYLRWCMRTEARHLAQDPFPRMKGQLQRPVDSTEDLRWDLLTREVAAAPREPRLLPFELEPLPEKIEERLAISCEDGLISALALWQQLTGERGVRRLTLQLIGDTDTILSSCDIAVQEEGMAEALLAAFRAHAAGHHERLRAALAALAALFNNVSPPAP